LCSFLRKKVLEGNLVKKVGKDRSNKIHGGKIEEEIAWYQPFISLLAG
jgi:hypothetical protein